MHGENPAITGVGCQQHPFDVLDAMFDVFSQCDESSVCSTIQKPPEALEDAEKEEHEANSPEDCFTDGTKTHKRIYSFV